jgi:hypothetical protein
MMKLRGKILVTLLVVGVLAGSYNELKRLSRPLIYPIKVRLFHPVLKETPEVYSIATLLKVYQVYDANGPIALRRIGRAGDGGYVVPELALQAADAIMGYGICDDISFEESATAIYGKPSWGFDGTCPLVKTQNALCHFIPLSIVSNASLKNAPEGSSSFDQQLGMFGLEGKSLFVKMDIEGNEYAVLPDILLHAKDITGIALEIHFSEDTQISQALHLMELLDKDFLLVHVHGNNCCLDHFVTKNAIGRLPRAMELSYINKNLVNKYEPSRNQTHPTKFDMPNDLGLSDLKFTILGG